MENIEMNINEMESINGSKGGSRNKLPGKAGLQVYRIVHGDTLHRIANRFKTNIATLKKLNPTIKNISDITAGFYLYVPMA